MQIFQHTFEIRKRSLISAFSIWMTVPIITDIYQYVADDIIAFSQFQVLNKVAVLVYL